MGPRRARWWPADRQRRHLPQLRAPKESPGRRHFRFGAHQLEARGLADLDLGLDPLAQILDQFQVLVGHLHLAAMPQHLVEGLFHRAANGKPGALNPVLAAVLGLARCFDPGLAERGQLDRLGKGVGLKNPGRSTPGIAHSGILGTRKEGDGRIRISPRRGNRRHGPLPLGRGHPELGVILFREH